VARIAVAAGLNEQVDYAVSWLVAAEAQASVLVRLVETAGWAHRSPEFDSERGSIADVAFRAFGDVAAGFAKAGDRHNAEALAGNVESGAGRAYVAARLADVLQEKGEPADAAELVEVALDALLSDFRFYWPDAYMEVAAGLPRCDRQADALKLAATLPDSTHRNDVIAIARALVADAPERAVTLLEQLAEFDPWSMHMSFTHPHFALQEAIEVIASRGEVERAADLLPRFDDDPWAHATRPWALSPLVDALAGFAAADPDRVAAIAFGMLAKVRASRSDVLDYTKSLAPVLQAVGGGMTAAALRELKAVPAWAGSPQPSLIGTEFS
jgi:hypothetical protein